MLYCFTWFLWPATQFSASATDFLSFYFFFSKHSKNDDDHILRKLRPGDLWYLTPLGSLATTQREYIALHAFRHLHAQVLFEIQLCRS